VGREEPSLGAIQFKDERTWITSGPYLNSGVPDPLIPGERARKVIKRLRENQGGNKVPRIPGLSKHRKGGSL